MKNFKTYFTLLFLGIIILALGVVQAKNIKSKPPKIPIHPSLKWPVALTFDDGPNPRLTPIILSILEKNHIPATFFVVGENAKAYPDILQRMNKDGDEIGNHTWNHPWMAKLNSDAQIKQIKKTTQSIQKALPDYKVKFFRPPYGSINKTLLKNLIVLNLKMILWTSDDEDYKGYTPKKIFSIVMNQAKPGGILLMHDIHKNTTQALEEEIEALRKEGSQFVTMSKLLQTKEYKDSHYTKYVHKKYHIL